MRIDRGCQENEGEGMKKHFALLLFFFLLAYLTEFRIKDIRAEGVMRVFVVPASVFLSAPDVKPPRVETAYVSRTYFHIAENLHEDRTMPNYAGRYSFAAFRMVDSVLYRDLFFITNPADIVEEGFYSIDYRILKSSVRSGLRTNEIALLKAEKSSLSMSAIESALVNLLKSRRSLLVLEDLSPINAYYSDLSPLKNVGSSLFPDKGRRSGIRAMEYLGCSGGKYLFRMFLANADNEKRKKEYTVSRGYYLYVSFDYKNDDCDCVYTVIDYSIYTK